MTIPHYQGSFVSGEITPELGGRVEIDRYANAVARLRNFISHAYGGVSRRMGTYYLGDTKYPDKKTRLIKFEYSSEVGQAYAMEFGDKYIRWWLPTGIVLTENPNPLLEPIPYEIVSPYGEEDLEGLSWVQSADIIWILHPNYPPHTLTRYDHDHWVLEEFVTKGGPYQDENEGDISITPTKNGEDIELLASDNIFEDYHVGKEFRIRQRVSEIEVKEEITSGTEVTGTLGPIQLWGEWELVTTGQGPTVSQWWEGEISIHRKYPEGDWQVIRKFTVQRDRDLAISGTEDEDFAEYKVEYTIKTNEGKPEDDPPIPVSTMTVQLHAKSVTKTGSVRITDVTDGKNAVGTEVSSLGEYGSATKLWSAPAWVEDIGYPRCGGFFQDRLFLGGSPRLGHTIWASKVANYSDFGISDPITDEDGITFRLSSRTAATIMSMIPLSELIVLTRGAEFRVSGEEGKPISATNLSVRPQSYDGCSRVAPEVLSNRVFFVHQSNKEIRDFAYSWEADSYSSTGISLLSRHMFENSTIKELGWQRYPDNILWCILHDGTMLGCTYLKEQEVIGWHKHTTQGNFENIACIAGQGGTDVYVIVKRNGRRMVEIVAERAEVESEDSFYVDSGLSYAGEPVNVISGLDHLEGMAVSILADGNVEPEQKVVGGSVTLSRSASKIHVGLGYSSEFQTLDIEYPNTQGKYQGAMKRISELKLRLYRSRGGKYGTSFDRMDMIKQHTGTQDGTALPLISGILEVVLPAMWDTSGRICIKQDDPLPMHILAVMPSVAQGG